MVTFSRAAKLKQMYKTVHAEDDEDAVEFMCDEYADQWAALAQVLVHQREEVNADAGLDEKAKKLREVKLGAKSDLGIIKMIHDLLVADARIDSLNQEDLTTEQLFGAVQRECRDNHVSVLGIEQNNLSMKRQVFEAQEWEWDPELMEKAEEFDIEKILEAAWEGSMRVYRVQWSDGTEGWEPLSALENVAEMLRDFEAAQEKKEAASVGSGRVARKRKKPVVESDEEEQGGQNGRNEGGGAEMTQAMMLMANSVAAMANMAATKTGSGGSGDAKDGSDGRLPGQRDLMGGFKRLKQVGVVHFIAERTMRRQRKSVMMAEHMPFAKKYNKRMDGLLVVETRKMECELQLRELRALMETPEVLQKIMEKEVRLMITEEWLVIDDTLDLLQGCSDTAMKGKTAKAWKMWDDAKEEQKGCSKTAEMKKRETAAEANLKEKAQTDQAMYLALQPGQQSAMYGGQGGNSFQQAQGGKGYGQQQQQGWQVQQPNQVWQAQQQQGWPIGSPQVGVVPRPMPPGPPPPNPFGGLALPKGGGKGGNGKMAGTYSTPTRFNFGKAEDVLGAKCPGNLRGVMVPLQGQMRFRRYGKSLRDPPKPPDPNIPPALCKQCWRMPPACAVSHEAFACEEVFDVNGVAAKGFRQLFQMGLLTDKGDII